MRISVLTLLFLFLLNLSVCPEDTEEKRPFYTAVNRIRQMQSAVPLGWDPLLAAAAADFAAQSVEQGYLSHRDIEGGYAVHRVRRKGGTALKVGEVLGFGQDAEGIVSAWMSSPSHRTVILSDEWTHAGAAAEKTETGILVVMLFRMRPFSRIELSQDDGHYDIHLIRDEGSSDTAVVMSRGKLYEASGSGSVSDLTLEQDEIFYHFLVGIRRNQRIIFTDRILLSKVLTH